MSESDIVGGFVVISMFLFIIFVGGMAALISFDKQMSKFRTSLEDINKRLGEEVKQLQLRQHETVRQLEESAGQSDNTVKRLADIVKEKKQRFLNIPNITFHFVNKDQVKSFYDDYFKEPTLESLVSEISGEVGAQIKGSLPQVLETKIGGKDLSKWISTIKLPDTSLNGMFLRYQRETIKNDQVVLGLEEVDIELTELQAFDNVVEELSRRFGFKIEENTLKNQRSYLKEKAAKRTITKLEQASGWILVDGRFRISHEDEFYRCVYQHPVGEYLAKQTSPITISFLIPSDSLEPHMAGNYAQSADRLIPLRVYGHVWQPLDSKANVWDLQLTPLAVY